MLTIFRTVAIFFPLLIHGATAHSQDKKLEMLNDATISLYEQEKYQEAAEMGETTLKTAEETLGAGSPNIVPFLNNLAVIYYAQGRYREAEAQYERALLITEEAFGPEHPRAESLLDGLRMCRQKLKEQKISEARMAPAPADTPAPAKTEELRPDAAGEPPKEPGAARREPSAQIYTVQVGAFKNLLNAKRLQDKLSRNGYDASISSVATGDGEILYKVQAGEFADRRRAEMMAKEIITLTGADTFITAK